ncbi:MAG TPA: class I SAM-dependent methyltransferase [Caulobacteraceae bacterium]|nr:class I SAM-dependent methyltransferase [Caulobacteraceae bacterium]
MAHLFGLPHASVRTCRVLDIGCGDGANLIPLAVAYPEARFVGFDLAAKAVERGQQVIETLGLSNIRLEAADVMQADFGAGAFDYIIAHGLYAWIPEGPRDALMASTRRHLAPDGVAFVSYNALPGCRIRQIIREALLFELRGLDSVRARYDAARRKAEELIETYSDEIPAQHLIRSELKELLERPLEVLAHDDLGDVYAPAYLKDFLAHAGRHGLQFLTEATLGRSGEGFTPPDSIDDPDFDVPSRLQQIDFKVMRSYRENLLIRAERPLDRRPRPERLADLFACAAVRPIEDEADVYDVGQKRVKLADPRLKAVVERIGETWPAALPVSELAFDEELGGALLRMFWGGIIELETGPPPYAAAVPARPCASPLARLQATLGGPRLTTLRHTMIEIGDPIGLKFIAGLDGVRTVAEIAADMAREFSQPVETMQAQVTTKLGELTKLALLA